MERVAAATGMSLVQDASNIPYARGDLKEVLTLIHDLKKRGIVTEFGRVTPPPDEPRNHDWFVAHRREQAAGGLSTSSDREALYAATAECLERYVWQYVIPPEKIFSSTTASLSLPNVPPSRFVGYSDEFRSREDRLRFDDAHEFGWTLGYSWTKRSRIYVPAQIVSAAYAKVAFKKHREPILREPITTGLATGPTPAFALLGGALEVIERDAFMIMWLNQLSPPRIAHDDLISRQPDLSLLLRRCTRYRLNVDFVRLVTDAPTYALLAVVRDPQNLPHTTIGMSAHRNPGRAAEKALLEALRARRNIRSRTNNLATRFDKPVHAIRHLERGSYWAIPEHATKLDFLTAGTRENLEQAVWESDSDEEHFSRIVTWCADNGYECSSISFTGVNENVTPWHIHFVIIPELQPMHQNEARPYASGRRLSEIPIRFGYPPRHAPFLDEPHPFI